MQTKAEDCSEYEANAHLIAAAPDLLTAAKHAAEWLKDTSSRGSFEVLLELEDAIDKAEGK